MPFFLLSSAAFTGLGAVLARKKQTSDALNDRMNSTNQSGFFNLGFGDKFIIGLGLTLILTVVVAKSLK